MNKELYNKSLGINETDVGRERDIDTLIHWKHEIKKDVINMREKHDQNKNELLLRDGQDKTEAAIAAHRALYAKDRQLLLLEIVEDRIKALS